MLHNLPVETKERLPDFANCLAKIVQLSDGCDGAGVKVRLVESFFQFIAPSSRFEPGWAKGRRLLSSDDSGEDVMAHKKWIRLRKLFPILDAQQGPF